MPNVLIADDNDCLRFAPRRVLEQAGHRVREAADGAQALRALRREPADLLVCDLFLSGAGGLEVLRAVRRDHPGLPVVAVSGGSSHGQDDVLRAAEYLGAARTLRKPFGMQALLEAVEE